MQTVGSSHTKKKKRNRPFVKLMSLNCPFKIKSPSNTVLCTKAGIAFDNALLLGKSISLSTVGGLLLSCAAKLWATGKTEARYRLAFDIQLLRKVSWLQPCKPWIDYTTAKGLSLIHI